MTYEIRTQIITDLPQKAYRNGVGNYEGVVAHATAVMNDSDENQLKYFIKNWKTRKAFAHFFNDHDSITQMADIRYIAWAAGTTANQRYVHAELCQSTDPKKFEEAYNRWTWLMAKLLFDKKLGVKDGVTLVSHKFCSDTWKDTTHQDPIEYLAYHGKKWDDVVYDVTLWYKKMEGFNMKKDDAMVIIKYLKLAYGTAKNDAEKAEIHRIANALRKAVGINE
jgi:N-acetylmuramoyl-L-alanine amidase CwlA